MRIWTITVYTNSRHVVTSFAKEEHVYKHIAELIRPKLNPETDPFDRVIEYCIKSGENKIAFEAFHNRRSSGISIVENELKGHIME